MILKTTKETMTLLKFFLLAKTALPLQMGSVQLEGCQIKMLLLQYVLCVNVCACILVHIYVYICVCTRKLLILAFFMFSNSVAII